MLSVTLSQFRSQQSDYIAAAQREPIEITSRGAGRRVVIVSPEFFDRAGKRWRNRLTSAVPPRLAAKRAGFAIRKLGFSVAPPVPGVVRYSDRGGTAHHSAST